MEKVHKTDLTYAAEDAVVLALLFAASAAPYLLGLGFYSDDWYFLSSMSLHGSQSVSGMLDVLTAMNNLAPRPMQILQLGASYLLFGIAPLPNHVVNHLVMLTGLLFLYFALRRLTRDRVLAFAVVAIYLALPHYATTRFWFSTAQANTSLLFFAISLLTAILYTETGRLRWVLVAGGTMLASCLAYEMFLPLFLLFGPIIALTRYGTEEAGVALRRSAILFAAALLIIALIIPFKLWALKGFRGDEGGDFGANILRLYAGVAGTSFWHLGVKMPAAAARVFAQDIGPWPAVVALFNVMVSAVWLRRITGRAGYRSSWRWIAALFAIGFAVFIGGYGALLTSFEAGFSPTGIVNRINIAAVLGVSLIGYAMLLALSRVPANRSPLFLAVLAGVVIGIGTFLCSAVGTYWTRAATRQNELLAAVRNAVPSMTDSQTLLFYGICPSVGPAPVFNHSWDTEGRLLEMYDARGIRSGVIEPSTLVGATAITTFDYDLARTHYFRDELVIYHAGTERAWSIPDAKAAEAFFRMHPVGDSTGCISRAGSGTPIL